MGFQLFPLSNYEQWYGKQLCTSSCMNMFSVLLDIHLGMKFLYLMIALRRCQSVFLCSCFKHCVYILTGNLLREQGCIFSKSTTMALCGPKHVKTSVHPLSIQWVLTEHLCVAVWKHWEYSSERKEYSWVPDLGV